jgi:hypothetical protein
MKEGWEVDMDNWRLEIGDRGMEISKSPVASL